MIQEKPNYHFILSVSLALIIIVESLIIINSLSRREKISQPSVLFPTTIWQPEAKKGTLSLTLNPGQTVKVNQNLLAQLAFDSQKEAIAGVDVILSFDPNLVSLVSIAENKELFEQILINQQEKAKGRIKITAYKPKKTLKNKQTLATLTIKLLTKQTASIGIEFLGPDRVTDSNLVSQANQKDILGSIQSLKLLPVE